VGEDSARVWGGRRVFGVDVESENNNSVGELKKHYGVYSITAGLPRRLHSPPRPETIVVV
jgi:hypothetical protein